MLHIRGYETWENPHIKLSESQHEDSRIIHGGLGLQFRNFYAEPGNMAFHFLDKNNNSLLFVNANGEVGIPGRATIGGQTYLEALTLSHDGTNGNIETWTGDINIQPAANVGIGTTDPRDKLEVKGNVRLDNGVGGGAAVRFAEDGISKWVLNYRPWASGKLSFTNDIGAGLALMTMDPVNNRVGIYQDNPAYRLDVNGDCHASSFPTSSDERFKKNIRPLENVLEKITRLHGISFDWNETYDSLGRSTGRREIGVIAQDVEAQFPELVTKWGDQNYRAVDYGRLSAVLIEAVKELKAENQALKQRVETLERKK